MSAANLKMGGSVAAATVGSGAATWLQWIPDDIGKLTSVVGIILSMVLIVQYTREIRRNHVEGKVRLELLKLELLEKAQQARQV